MKKLFPLALAIASASFAMIPASAMALDTTHKYNVFIHNHNQEVKVGTWVIEYDQPWNYDPSLGQPELETCRYFIKWTNYCDLPTRANLFVDEVSLPGESDCDLNSTSFLSTLIFNTACDVSKGFDKFNSKRTVVNLIAGQDGESGDINGVIQFSGGTVYALAAEAVP